MRFRSANRFDPTEIERRQDPEKEMRGDLLFFTILLIVAILWIYVIPNYVYLSLPVLGHSMEPTFRNSGDTVGVLRLTGYAYGDIVIAYSNDGTLVIKRVLALGGDTITQVDEHTVRIEQEDGEVIVLKSPFCSTKHRQYLYDANISIEYCNCNSFGVVLNGSGNETDLSKNNSAYIESSIIASFNTLSELFNNFLNYGNEESFQECWKIEVGSSEYSVYSQFFGKATEIFEKAKISIGDGNKNIESSVIIGINNPYCITFEDDKHWEYSELQTVVARLFGYSDIDMFTQYSQKIIDTYLQDSENIENENLKFDGVIHTANGSFVLPFAFKTNEGTTVRSFVIINASGKMFIWLDNIGAAFKATNVYNDFYNPNVEDNDVNSIEIYGRCTLFEESRETYIYGQNDSANNGKTWHLEEDEVFLAGDHREVSKDSFDYGPIGRSQLVGRVILLFRDGGISRVVNTWADLFTALPSSESPALTPLPAPGSETLSGLSAAA